MNLPEWYALQVITGKEEATIAEAESHHGIHGIAPVRVLRERHQGYWRDVRHVAFPGYAFIRTTMSDETYYTIKTLKHLLRILGNSFVPLPIPMEQMLPVLALSNDGNDFGISTMYKAGDMTRVTGGPLMGLEAYIIKVDARRRRATVEIKLLGKTHHIDLGVEVIRPTISEVSRLG